MRLSSTDIKRVKRLSLRETKLPKKQETPVEVITAPQSPSEEEVVYRTMAGKYPLLESLVASLDLEPVKTVKRVEDKPQPVDKNKLRTIAERTLSGNSSYPKEEIIDRLQREAEVSRERAERGFTLMVGAGIIETIDQETYYLGGSAPF